jgi:hypothetical protein
MSLFLIYHLPKHLDLFVVCILTAATFQLYVSTCELTTVLQYFAPAGAYVTCPSQGSLNQLSLQHQFIHSCLLVNVPPESPVTVLKG